MINDVDAAEAPRGGELPSPAFMPRGWVRSKPLPGSLAHHASRAEKAADLIGAIAAKARPGERIGSKDALRETCAVSVGTFNEAIKLALERGVISSRPGPGGGLFALEPPPLARMNSWFRAASGNADALDNAMSIRGALAPLLAAEVLASITDARQRELELQLALLHREHERGDVIEYVWAAWNLHAKVAGISTNALLEALYLSTMDVATSFLRTTLQHHGSTEITRAVWFGPFTAIQDSLVAGIRDRDPGAIVGAICRTNPKVLLSPAPAEGTGTMV